MIKKTIFFSLMFFITSVLSARFYDINYIEITKNKPYLLDSSYIFNLKDFSDINCTSGINITVKKTNYKFLIVPNKNFTGIDVIKFTRQKNTYLLPVIVKTFYNKIQFVYKSTNSKLSVFVAGSFNGWNAAKNRLNYDNTSKSYTNTVLLKSGEYFYKFVVDNKWIYDKSNPNKRSDGFGSYNSVLKLGENKKNISLHPYKKESKRISFICLNTNINLSGKDFLIILNNKIIKDFKTTENIISIPIQANLKSLKIFFNKKGYNIYKFIYSKKLNKLKKSIIYFVFTDRFYNGDKSNDRIVQPPGLDKYCDYMGGDFKGLTEKIKSGYFKKLGIDTLWISPVNDNTESFYKDFLPPHKKFGAYHGYWPISSYDVENHFGTEDDLHSLIDTLHFNNMKIMFDMVFNHTQSNHILYKTHKDWYGSMYTPDKKLNLRLFDAYPFTTWFDTFLPSFDYINNAEVNKFMCNNAVWWIKNYNVDGFRLDAVKHIPDKFWKLLTKTIRQEIEIPEDKLFLTLGETISDRETINKFIGYNMLSGQFDFPLYWEIRNSIASDISDFVNLNDAVVRNTKFYRKDSLISSFLGNHDFPRFMAYADNDIRPNSADARKYAFNHTIKVNNEKNYEKLKTAFLFLMSISEIPMIYYGDEIGLSGAADPDNRRMMKFNNLSAKQQELFNFVSKLIQLRKTYKALYLGDYIPLIVNKNQLVFIKLYFNEFIIAGISRKNNFNINLTLPSFIIPKKIIDILSNEKIKATKKIEIKNKKYFLLSGQL